MLLSPARGQIFEVSALEFWIMGASLLGLLAIEGLMAWWAHRLNRKSWSLWWQKCVVYFSLFCLLSSHLIYAVADARYYQPILMSSESIPLYYGMTAKRLLNKIHIMDVVTRPNFSSISKNKPLNYPRHALEREPMQQKPNVLIIGLDSWRFDSFNPKVTPQISNFAKQAWQFDQHFSGGNSTRAGIFSLFYSLPANYFDAFYQSGKGPLLFDLLYAENYEVGVYLSATALVPPFNRSVFAGIKDLRINTPGKDSAERDKRITQDIIRFIKASRKKHKPFMGFVFYDSPHNYHFPKQGFKPPFLPTKQVNHFALGNPKNAALYWNQYLNTVYFVDGLVGQIFDTLKRMQLMQNTIVIITGDHSEEFNDNGTGFWGHNGNFTPAQTHVPMIVYWPGRSSPMHFSHITSHYDVIPSLMKVLFRVKNPTDDYAIGYPLWDESKRNYILIGSYSHMALFEPANHLITTIARMGVYHITDDKGRNRSDLSIDIDKMIDAFKMMHRYYANT